MAHQGEILLDRYRLEKPLGAGGFGVVYLATQLPLGRLVAVKLLSVSSTAESARFEQEAALAQRLDHPHTVRIIDFGRTPKGLPLIVWEYLRGETLGDFLRQHPGLPPAVARRIAVQVLKSLMEAHGLGIVHRDIKPANIFVTPHPGEPYFVKVLDFGIAKNIFAPNSNEPTPSAPSPSAQAYEITHQTMNTRASQMVGTPRYMSPEQANGQPIGPDTDLYSVGLVLCEMLTGQQVFDQDNALDLLLAQGSDDPVPIPPAVLSSPLGPVVARATQKQRAMRYASAAQMIADLESIRLSDDQPSSGTFSTARASGTLATPLLQNPPSSTLDPNRSSQAAMAHAGGSGAIATPQQGTSPTTQTFSSTPLGIPSPKKPRSRTGIIALVLSALVLGGGGVALALTRPWESTTKTKKKKVAASSQKAREAPPMLPDSALDPYNLPPPPNIDWASRTVPEYDNEGLKDLIVKSGYEVRRADPTDLAGFHMMIYTVTKPPCGGSVQLFKYDDPSVAENSWSGMKDQKNARVVRGKNRILLVALARVQHPEGDPACADPLAAALTK